MESILQLFEKPTFLFTWLFLCLFAVLLTLVCNRVLDWFGSRHNIKIKLLCASTMLSLILAEATLRITGISETYSEKRFGYYVYLKHGAYTDTFHVHFPDSTHILGDEVNFAYSRTTNSLGISAPEWAIEKPQGVQRIVAIGDSFTEGDGAPADSSWPALLDNQLQAEGSRVEVLNAGVCGSDPFYAFMLLKHRLLNYRPDKVIVAISIQDFVEDIGVRGGFERFDPTQGKRPALYELAYSYSHLLRLVYHRFLGYSSVLIKDKDNDFVELVVNQHIPDLFEKFASLKKLVDIHFVLYPHRHEYYDGYRPEFSKALRIHAERNGFSFHDLRDCYNVEIANSNKTAEEFWWKHDGHHNSNGYEVMAECIKQKIDS